MELDLAALASALGCPAGGASLQHNPSEKEVDFFISFSHADVEIAGRINQILLQRGYTTIFLPSHEGAGQNFIAEIHDGLRRSRRMILLLSPAYLLSAYGGREWQAFLPRDPDGRKRLLVLFKVAECEIDGLLSPLTVVDVVGKQGGELKDAVIRAAICSSETGIPAQHSYHYFAPTAEPDNRPAQTDEERRGNLSIGWVPVMVMMIFIGVLALVPAVPTVINTDMRLPLRWMIFGGNLREHSIVETDPLPLRYWVGIGDRRAKLGPNKQWLDLKETALLKSTKTARDGIAQYTVGFEQGGLYLLTRSSTAVDSAYETRLEYAKPGELRILVGRRDPHRYTPIPHSRTAPIYVGTRTMHDVAVSMVGDLHTVWVNGRNVTTFEDQDKAGRFSEGAVGLRVALQDKVRLYRWSINLDVQPDLTSKSADLRAGLSLLQPSLAHP